MMCGVTTAHTLTNSFERASMYPLLDLKRRTTTKLGAHARYFRISKYRGVRVYEAGEYSERGGAFDKSEVDFSQVEIDLDLIQSIQCRIVPKAYRIVLVRWDSLYYAGLVMEHVEGVHLDKLTRSRTQRMSIKLNNMMAKIYHEFAYLTGYVHEDLHGYNVIFNKKTKAYKVIDLCGEFLNPIAW